MALSPKDALSKASKDFRYLLENNYPRPGALKYVGDHHQLAKFQRELLNRGVFSRLQAKARLEKFVSITDLTGNPLAVDGHNILITLESAILGKTLVDADDGVIRDISGVGSSFRPSRTTEQAISIFIEFAQTVRPSEVLFLLDSPMSKSGELAGRIMNEMRSAGLTGSARAEKSPERRLHEFKGIVASGDSVIIDHAAQPFDLAGHIIRNSLNIEPEKLMRFR